MEPCGGTGAAPFWRLDQAHAGAAFSAPAAPTAALFAARSGTMFRLPALAASSPRPLRPWHRAALFGAGLLVLWLALQLAPPAPTPAPTVRPAAAEGRIPARDARPAAGPAEGAPLVTRPERGLFRAGNVIALLLLAGGGVWAVHLRRQRAAGDGPAEAPTLRALDALTLAPGQSVRLVAVGDEVLLLGVAQGGVSLLCRYDAADAPVAPDAPPRPAPLSADFGELLLRAQGRPATHA